MQSMWSPSTLEPLVLGSHDGFFETDVNLDANGCFSPAVKSGATTFTRIGTRFRASIKRSKSLTRRSGEVHSRRSVVEPRAKSSAATEADEETKRSRRRSALTTQKSFHHSLDSLDATTSFGDPNTTVNLALNPPPRVDTLHSSISPSEHCFYIAFANAGGLYFSAPSSDAKEVWIERIDRQIGEAKREHISPQKGLNPQDVRHIYHYSLRLANAKGMKDGGKSKGYYFCDFEVNNRLYSRTASNALENDAVTWNDQFQVAVPYMKSVTIKLFRDGHAPSPRQRSKSGDIHQAVPLGKVVIDVRSGMTSGEEKTEWTAMEGTGLSILTTTLYYHLVVLPLEFYGKLVELVVNNPRLVCDVFEPHMKPHSKEHFAYSMMKILGAAGKASDFVAEVVVEEVKGLDSVSMIFRGNTFASKLMECHMRIVLSDYLRVALREAMIDIYGFDCDVEVDPSKLPPNFPNSSLLNNQANLIIMVEKIWCRLNSTSADFPRELSATLYKIRILLNALMNQDVSRRLVAGSVFLRLICPAMIHPNTFNVTHARRTSKVERRLILVVKVLQNMASLTKSKSREAFLHFTNDFISRERARVEAYLDRVCSLPDAAPSESRLSPDISSVASVSAGPAETPKLPRLPPPQGLDCLPFAKPDIGKDIAFLHEVLKRHITDIPESAQAAEQGKLMQEVNRITSVSDRVAQNFSWAAYSKHGKQESSSSLKAGSAAQQQQQQHLDADTDIRPTPVSGGSNRHDSREQLPHKRLSSNEEPCTDTLLAKSFVGAVPPAEPQQPQQQQAKGTSGTQWQYSPHYQQRYPHLHPQQQQQQQQQQQ
eukprot:scpid54151/ scgid5211/ Disabled homolog 2-interacting protein